MNGRFSCVVWGPMVPGRNILLIFMCLLAPVAAQQPKPGEARTSAATNDKEINPPFGLEWTEDSKRVELKIAAAKLTIKETEHNFGEVKKTANPTYTFTFKNEGKADLEIKRVAPT